MFRKTISILITACLLINSSHDVTAFAQSDLTQSRHTLAAPSIFQQSSPNEGSEDFRQSIFSDSDLLGVFFSIGSHFLADNRKSSTLQRSIKDEFRNTPQILEVLEYIDFDNVRRGEDVVYIPYTRADKKYEARICSREKLEALPKGLSQWAISKDWGIQIVAKSGDRNREKSRTRANDESLIGHGFRNEDLDSISLVPWTQSEDFRVAVERDLPMVIDELPMSAGLRGLLHRALDDFKNGKDGCRLGIMPALYVNADRWYIEFGTSRSIGVATEFFDRTNPFYPHRLQALFHALFHAALNQEEEEEYHEFRIGLNATAHLDAMRFSALKWWNVPPELHEAVRCATAKQLKDPDQTVLSGVRNEFGQAILAWKLEQSKIPTRMAEDNWKALLAELRHILRPRRTDAEELFRFLSLCTVNPSPIFGDPHRYPTESRYPVLRAVSLLSRHNKEKLTDFLIDPDNAYMLANPIVDSILLMLNGIPKDWAAAQAPEIQGRRVWEVSPELWHAGGGLGRVKQFEGIAMKEFLGSAATAFCHIEPYYHYAKNRITGERQRVDYSSVLGIKDDAPPEEKPREVFRLPVTVGTDTTTAVCYRAINEHGIETFLIKGFKKGQDVGKDVPYYTPMLYEYDSWYGPDGRYNPNHGLTRDEFAFFLSAASLELIKRVEESARFTNEKTWRPPIIHFNDGQLGFAPYLRKTRYANDPVLKDAFVAFTTHTYFNRQAFKHKFAQEVPEQTYLLRPSGISYEEEMRYFQHLMDLSERQEDRFASVCDYSSAGIRSADWVNGVSAEHVRRLLQLGYDTWGIWTNLVDLVAVTNGDVRTLTAARFRQAMREVYGDDVDVEEPTSGQVARTKRRTKEMLNEEYGTKLDPNLPVLSYSGRGVGEKAGRHRALSDYNIEELVKMGAQVVIGCNVQASPDIVGEWERLEAYLRNEKEKDPVKYRGAFILMRNIDITVQRSILAASDFQVQDSDPITEAAGFSEADISACGGIEIAPPWREGILQMQGVKMNLDVLGEGNYLIPEIEVSENDFHKLRRPYDPRMNKTIGDAYFEIIRKALNIGDTMEDTMKKLAHYQATSVRLSRVLEARLTVAEYMRQWSKAIAARAVKTAVPDASAAPQSAAADTAQNGTRGKAINLIGSELTPELHASVNSAWRALITAGKTASLFTPRPGRLPGDVDIPVDATQNAFFNALRTFAKELFKDKLEPDFDVIIGDDDRDSGLPALVVLHPGNRRGQAYIPRSYLRTLSEFFAALGTDEERAEFIQVVFESFEHEDMHLRQYKSTLGSLAPPRSERDIDHLAPSFRARALFRLAYAYQKTGVMPDMSRFLSDLEKSEGARISYLNGYMNLDLDKHIDMAGSLLADSPSQIDTVLAQHHLGAIFNHAEIDSPVFQRARELLEARGAIDIGPETERPFPVWKFIRELIRQNALIEEERPFDERNIKARGLDQFEPWRRGAEAHTGNSTLYPLAGQTTALPVSMEKAIERIRAMTKLNGLVKEAIIDSLKPSDDGGTIISREALETIGSPLIGSCAVSISAAGAGMRFAEIVFDENGEKIRIDKAKAVYKIPVDGERSILELRIAQIRGLNLKYNANIPLDIYTSHFTDNDVRAELRRLGFSEEPTDGVVAQAVFTHPMPGSPRVHIIRIRKASLFDEASSDFYKNVEPSLPWTETFWPDAHDTAFIDFIVSGRAYESVRAGLRYKSTFNVDNCAGLPDPVILAIVRLTGVSLMNEGVLKPEGARGGADVIFKEGQNRPSAIDFGRRRGILEEYEFDKKFLDGLTSGEIQLYFPLFNSANYTEDIIGFTRDAFWPEGSDEDIVRFLKECYEARGDPEKTSELRFMIENRYRRKTQQWERDKRYPALQPSNLAGTLTWLVPTLFLEVPAGPEAGSYTRFEPLKENIVNFRNDRSFVSFLLTQNSSDTAVANAALSPVHRQLREEARLADLKAKYAARPVTLAEVIAGLDKSIRAIEDSLRRVADKRIQVYDKAVSPSGSERPRAKGAKGRPESRDLYAKSVADMADLHKEMTDIERIQPMIEDGKTLWHIIPITLIPRDPLYNQRTRFVKFVNEFNRKYPEAREKIRIVSERQDMAEFVNSFVRENPDAIVDVALDSEASIEKMPDGVKILLFRPKDGEIGNFRQLGGMLAALRALHINDLSQRRERLERIHRLMTGEDKEMPDVSDPKEFARRYQFILPPVTIKGKEELRRLNENLLRLIESA